MTHEPDPGLPWVPRQILRVEVGSTAHGTGTVETEDYDELGVMALPWTQTLGVPVKPDRDETIVYRPGRKEGERSQAGDYDLTMHSARKFCRLAATGNPSVLMVLFGPVRFTTPLGDALRSDEMIKAFWHQGARQKFLGYCKAQRERLEGIRGGKHTNRPELIEQYGFDTKYAMHMLRLGYQGIEYMATGRVTLPMPPGIRAHLQDVRAGRVDLYEVLDECDNLERQLAEQESAAPPEPDWDTLNDWLLSVFDWEYGLSSWKPCIPVACPPLQDIVIDYTTDRKPEPGRFAREAAEFYGGPIA